MQSMGHLSSFPCELRGIVQTTAFLKPCLVFAGPATRASAFGTTAPLLSHKVPEFQAGFQGCNVMGQGFKVAGARVGKIQSYRVPGLQGYRVPRSKVPRSQGSRITWFQDSKVAFFRVYIGNWELHLQFPDVQPLWTIKTQAECRIVRAYRLNLAKECAGICCVHIGWNIKGTTKG